jgi:hypothetical protein
MRTLSAAGHVRAAERERMMLRGRAVKGCDDVSCGGVEEHVAGECN